MSSSPLAPLVNPPAPYPPGAPRACKPTPFVKLRPKPEQAPRPFPTILCSYALQETSNQEPESKIQVSDPKKEVFSKKTLKVEKDHKEEGIAKLKELRAEELHDQHEKIAESKPLLRIAALQRSLLQGTTVQELESKIKEIVARVKVEKRKKDEGIAKLKKLQAEELLAQHVKIAESKLAESKLLLQLQSSLRLQGTAMLEQLESKIQQNLPKKEVTQQKTLKDEKIAELTRLLQLRAEKLLKKDVTQEKTLESEKDHKDERIAQLTRSSQLQAEKLLAQDERIAEFTRLLQLQTAQIRALESKIAKGKTTNAELKPTLLSQLQAKKIEKLESKIESNAQQEILLREEIATLEANLQSKRNELKDGEVRLEKRQQVESWLIEAGEESNKRVSRLQNAVGCSLRREKVLRKDVTQQKALVAKLQGEKKIQAERIATLKSSSELQVLAIRKLESKIESHDKQESLLQKEMTRLQNEAASSLRQEKRLKRDVAELEDEISLNAETIEGLENSLENAKEVYGAERDNLLGKIADLEARLASATTEIPDKEEEMEFVQISMDDMDAAIDDGDWDAVDEASKAFDKGDQESSMAGSSKGMTPDKNYEDIEDESYSESYFGSGGSTTTEDHRKEAEYRAQVEELVQIVLPDETEKVDAMMDQFKGREAELLSTLQTMEERMSSQRARVALRKSKPPSQHQYLMGGTNSGVIQGGEGSTAGTAAASHQNHLPEIRHQTQYEVEGSEYSNEYDDQSYYSGENSQEGSGSFYSEGESASRSYYSEEGSQERSFYSQEEGSQEGSFYSQEEGSEE